MAMINWFNRLFGEKKHDVAAQADIESLRSLTDSKRQPQRLLFQSGGLSNTDSCSGGTRYHYVGLPWLGGQRIEHPVQPHPDNRAWSKRFDPN